MCERLKKEMSYYTVKMYPNIVEFIVNKIRDLGEDLEMPKYDIIAGEHNSVIYTVNKKINLQGIVAHKIADYNTAEKLINLLSNYLSLTFERLGISFKRGNAHVWIDSLKSDQPVVTFTAMSEYDFRRNDMDNIMKETLDIGINYLLKYDKNLVEHYSHPEMLMSEFVDFFNDYKEIKKNYIELQSGLNLKDQEGQERKIRNTNKI